MAEDNLDETTTDQEPPAVTLQDFEAAVRVLKALCEGVRFIIFLGRGNAVKLVGNPQDFQRLMSQDVNHEVDINTANRILAEIRRFARAGVFFNKIDRALAFLQQHIFDDDIKKLHGKSEKDAFRQTLQTKLELSLSLLPPAFKERQQRLRTATDASLEELDVEIIRERRDEYHSAVVDQPFARLRLRYSDGLGMEAFPWFWGRSPWGDDVGACKTFLLECDEMDIDVLMFRLREAKKLLLSAVSGSTSGQ
jgi:hypothetical protein